MNVLADATVKMRLSEPGNEIEAMTLGALAAFLGRKARPLQSLRKRSC